MNTIATANGTAYLSGRPRLSDRTPSAKVLVVDDDVIAQRAVASALRFEGYDVLLASTRASALTTFVASDVSLVLVDLRNEDASALLDDLLDIRQDTAVLLVVGQADVAKARHALRRGAMGCIRSPLDPFELRTQIYAAWMRQQATARAREASADAERLIRRQVPCQLAERLAMASRLRDAETGAHVARIGRMSTVLARALDFSDDAADLLGAAATTHDVGKIAIPDSILRKPGPLTVDEFETMKQHTVLGATILRGTNLPVLELAERIALSHHERWDGTGYPHGLRGEACPLPARIVALVDVYDALTHARVYKAAWDEPRVLALLEEQRDRQFQGRLVDAFLEALPQIRKVSVDLPDEA